MKLKNNCTRPYIAVSVKHTMYKWKFGKPLVMWGTHQTDDTEKRCFGGYTEFPNYSERYNIGEMKEHGYGEYIKDDEAVPITINFCKRWKEYDTVFVTVDDVMKYYQTCELRVE